MSVLPLYDYGCQECGHEWEGSNTVEKRYEAKCPLCKAGAKIMFKSAHIQIFKPMVYTDICETPLLIESKKQLREECKKHGVQAVRLM